MKKLLLIAALPVLFSACKQPDPPASVSAPTPTSAPAEASGERSALPHGLALDVPYAVLSDEWTDESEERKRKVVIEFQQADAARVGQAVTDSMIAARYRLTGQSEARGGERYNFRADGGVRASILVRPRGAVKLQDSRSTGNIEYSYTEPLEAPGQVQDAGSRAGQGAN
ncbi:hypothetical protein FZO89_13140 [Luteimonas viscosa]|uniref:Lipoprotein n=1 Tax=Luteimonas viscosa TaxID=1132694 RepID=A0A5D4XR50_9GAMM|nr:hypothetical protein [Luteimonas viscosa]TYT27126.1 hypothetical protein FZO89_13140 [Luteimonas viscosa]